MDLVDRGKFSLRVAAFAVLALVCWKRPRARCQKRSNQSSYSLSPSHHDNHDLLAYRDDDVKGYHDEDEADFEYDDDNLDMHDEEIAVIAYRRNGYRYKD